MDKYYCMSLNDRLLVMSVIIERWESYGIVSSGIKFKPSCVSFENPKETSRVLFIMSFFIINKEAPTISSVIEDSSCINDSIKEVLGIYESMSFKDKLEFLSKEFMNYYNAKEYRNINLFKKPGNNLSFKNLSNNITKYVKAL
ncbi:MAG: hypothetical protein RR984_03285 [Bacilli bacterium]